MRLDRVAPGSPDHIAAEEDVHKGLLTLTQLERRPRAHTPTLPASGGGSYNPPSLAGRVGLIARRIKKRWVEPLRPSALQTHRGPALQVGAMCRSHDFDRDSSRTVDIGPGVKRPNAPRSPTRS